MKAIILFICISIFTLEMNAQVKVPKPSTSSKIEQVVGLTDIKVSYSRPSKKGRTIYGGLVPYGKMWRTGANKNTEITLSDDVKVNGQELKKGTYAIFTKPGKDSWDIVFYTDTENWGTPKNWDESKVAAKISSKPSKIPGVIETFTIMFNDITMDTAKMYFLWDDLEVPVTFKVPAKEQAMASIEKTMGGPTADDHYHAAVFYKEIENYDKAKKHIEKAVAAKKDAYWVHRQHSLILAKKGDKNGAIKAAKMSMKLAEKAGNNDYIKLNKDSLKKWVASN